MSYDMVLCGTGGQGVVLISKIIADAALKSGLEITIMENHGHARRFGSVSCHVRIGKSYSPTIPRESARLLTALEPIEALRNIQYLMDGGEVVIDTNPSPFIGSEGINLSRVVESIREKTLNLVLVDSVELSALAGNSLYRNMVMLGAITAVDDFPIGSGAIKKSLRASVPKQVESNLKAFGLGFRSVKDNDVKG